MSYQLPYAIKLKLAKMDCVKKINVSLYEVFG